jgi:nonsense-mediated mRNA decay protein 3
MYWRMPFDALATYSDLVEFTVLDVECTGLQSGKWLLAEAQVAVSGAFKSPGIHEHGELDYESRAFKNQIFYTRTHLGAIIQPGDTVLGYHITNANYNSDEFASLPSSEVPDVVLVKKSYPNQSKKNKARNWRLRSIVKEKAGEEAGEGRGFLGRTSNRENKKADEDYELFLRDLEEDPEMRAAVNLYKGRQQHKDIADADDHPSTKGRQTSPMDIDVTPPVAAQVDHEDGEEDADFPEVKLEELLDDFDEMTLGEN